MTLTMGAYYDKGIIMIADRRLMQGYKYTEHTKLFTMRNGEIVVAFTGLVGVADQLKKKVEASSEFQGASTLCEALDHMEAVIALLCRAYLQQGTFTEEDSISSGLVGGLEELKRGQPLLYMLGQKGYADPVFRTSTEPYTADGAARDLADSLLKTFYKPNLPRERLTEVPTYVMLKVQEIHSAVGGMPHIATLEENTLPYLMNEQEIINVVNKIRDIDSTIAKLFWKILEKPTFMKQVLGLLEE